MNGFQSFPKPPRPRIDKTIIDILLKIKQVQAEYPRALYDPRRAAYIAQVETKSPTSGKAGDRT
jgi:hypothetical protein